MKRKLFYICIFVVIIFLASLIFHIYSPTPKQTPIILKCPENYASQNDYLSALDVYIHQESAKNPNITAEELYKQRYQFLVANNCTKTLQTLRDNLPPGSGTTPGDIIKNEMKTYNTVH